MHIFPLLSLLQKGVKSTTFTKYEEGDDFAFWDKFFRISPEGSERPYFDPLTRTYRIATHPHSNIATARKGTFEKSWNAVQSKMEYGNTLWKLAENFADIVRDRALTRGGKSTRVNVIDVACWLFRQQQFDDSASTKTLLEDFRKTFPLSDDDFNKLFEFVDEPSSKIFSSSPLTVKEIKEITDSLAVSDAPPSRIETPSPAPYGEIERSNLADDDPILLDARRLIQIGSSGIVLRGCPGTGKSWYAWNIALQLTKGVKKDRIFRVQFHPSYGYEDFVEGYKPDEGTKSGFKIFPKIFLEAVKAALTSTQPVVLIIDEINRGDTARIFGEVLTYLETGWRDTEFLLAYSGERSRVPGNLIVLATMNPHDRSITQLDMALMRRFDHIDVHPSKEKVGDFLTGAGMDSAQSKLIVDWFDDIQSLMPFGIGHTYFVGIGNVATLSTIWRFRILPFAQSVLELEPDKLENVAKSFESLEARLRSPSA